MIIRNKNSDNLIYIHRIYIQKYIKNKYSAFDIVETHFPYYQSDNSQPQRSTINFKDDRVPRSTSSTKKMSSSEPSSPSSVLEVTTPILEKRDSIELRDDNNAVDDSDPWAFLEKELEEFQRIVAELEQIKIQKRQSDFEPSSHSSFFHHQKTSYIESSVTVTNGTKDNNDEKKLEISDNCDDSREIPILRLSNSHESPKEIPDESNSADQSTSENEVITSIKEKLRINVNLPDTPEPGPLFNQDNGVTIQKKPKPPPSPKPNLKPKPKSSFGNPSTSRIDTESITKSRAITETGEIHSMTESLRNSPGYKSSISYTTV